LGSFRPRFAAQEPQLQLDRRQDVMTSGFVVATDPVSPPVGLERAVYAIGNFDGLHLGHAAVIERAVRVARERAAPVALLTFEPHPADHFAGRPVAFRLTPPALKAALGRGLGLSGIVFLSFDSGLAGMTADEFVRRILVERLATGAVVVGWDFHFGKGRSGGPAFLAEAGARHGFAVEIVGKIQVGTEPDGAVISSTAVRRALERGDVDGAARLLGRCYSVSGIIAPGQRLGRVLGMPTANIALEPTNRLAYGVYAVRAVADGHSHPAVASFGVRPSVDGGGPPLLEVHLFDFEGDLYGQEMTVEFVGRIREERRFDSLDLLVAEMRRDGERAREILARPG
jgi:riboflavin kinase / FMN adenylyltransferase